MAKARTRTTSTSTSTTPASKRRKTPKLPPAELAEVVASKADSAKVIDMTTPPKAKDAPKKAAPAKKPGYYAAHPHRTMGNVMKRAKGMRSSVKQLRGWILKTPDSDVENKKLLTAASSALTEAVAAMDKAAEALADIPKDFKVTAPRKAAVAVGSTVRFKKGYEEDYLEFFIAAEGESFELVKQLKGHKRFLAKSKSGQMMAVVRAMIEPAPEEAASDER